MINPAHEDYKHRDVGVVSCVLAYNDSESTLAQSAICCTFVSASAAMLEQELD